jgi:hypothetical protein
MQSLLQYCSKEVGGRVGFVVLPSGTAPRLHGQVSTQDTSAQTGCLVVLTHSSGPCTASQRAVHGYRSLPDAAIMRR